MPKQNGIRYIQQVGRGAQPQHSAYLVAGLRQNGTYVASIFSEPHPTIIGLQATAVVWETKAANYDLARRELLRFAKQTWPWMKITNRGWLPRP